MKKEIRIFFTAIMFYTRIPCPKWVDHADEYLQKSTRYFSLIGIIVGSVSGLVFLGASSVLPASVSVILSMLGSILLTGAFHEDGLADVCDGFGGGWTKEKILLIMKDSRVGAYGVIGLILALLLKYALLTYTVPVFTYSGARLFMFVLIAAHASSRFVAATIMYTHTYARSDETSKISGVAGKLPLKDLLIAALFGLAPFFLLHNWLVFLILIPMFLMRGYLGWYFKKWIGGYTGDCLGATQQILEIIFYLGLLIVWKFT